MISPSNKPMSALHHRNEYHEYSLQLNRWFLKPIGVWPQVHSTTTAEKHLSKIIQITCYTLIAFTVFPCMLYFYFEEQDLDIKMDSVGLVNHWIMSGISYSFLLWRGKDMRRCIEHIKSDWCMVSKVEDRELMIKYAKFGRFVAGFCAMFMHCGVFSYSIVYSLSPITIVIGNQSVSIRRLPCPFYSKLLDTNHDLTANHIVLAIQILSGFIANSITVGACSLAAVFATHACGQFAVLYSHLNKLVKKEEKLSAEHKLANIVKHHLRVLNFLSCFEKMMNQVCMVQLVECTLNLCLLGFCSIKEWKARNTKTLTTYGILFISLSFNIFILCYIGELITEQCTKVAEIAYFTDWYHLPHKTALGIVLIISRSNAVIKITAGKLVQLSLTTFGNVMKTSAAYLNILRTLTM